MVVVGRALVPNYLVTVQKNLSESILRIVLLHGVRSDGRRVILEVRERLTRVPDAAEGVLDLPAHVIVLIAVLGVLQFYIRQLSDFAIEKLTAPREQVNRIVLARELASLLSLQRARDLGRTG